MNDEVSRPTRVALEIRKTLSEILHRDTKDPRLEKVNITECKISKDLSIATVYFTIIGANEDEPAAQDAIKALEKAKGFFRSEIGKRMKLRITPEIRFFYDTVAENASHIEELIFKALHQNKKQALTGCMAKKQWQAVDGIVLLNKPEGVTSNGILQQVRRLYNAKKAGHTGALDPFATGLLPLCFGEATKISGLLLDSDKRYIATLSLGVETDSGDKDGNPLQTVTVPTLNAESIQTVLKGFEGDIMQVPPMYSALKHQGIPLYEYARKGVEVERVPRPVTIHELTLIDFHPTEITFEVFCSKGTYVRTLGEEIAKALDTLGHLTALHRTQTGSLRGDDMATVAEIEQDLTGHLQPLDLPLQHLEAMHLNESDTQRIQHGGKLAVSKPTTDLVRFYDPQKRFIGVGEWQTEKNLLKPKRLFNLAD